MSRKGKCWPRLVGGKRHSLGSVASKQANYCSQTIDILCWNVVVDNCHCCWVLDMFWFHWQGRIRSRRSSKGTCSRHPSHAFLLPCTVSPLCPEFYLNVELYSQLQNRLRPLSPKKILSTDLFLFVIRCTLQYQATSILEGYTFLTTIASKTAFPFVRSCRKFYLATYIEVIILKAT